MDLGFVKPGNNAFAIAPVAPSSLRSHSAWHIMLIVCHELIRVDTSRNQNVQAKFQAL